ncbi:ADP-heptose--LPS heptosyltransferase 2 [Candidatus Hartigia pinicola]|nr:ADP-heptose--LPS heptosyltransferase 2 [Candidatus Hartigia pinicola]
MKILVIGPSWIGDMVMSQSLYRTLKTQYSDVQIDVVAPQWCYPLLAKMPEVNTAILMPLVHGKFSISERRKIGISLRKKEYNQAIVLPNSFKSALVPFFTKIQKRTGWVGEMRYGLLNDIRTLDKNKFPLMVQRYVALAYDKHKISYATDIATPILWPKLVIDKRDVLKTINFFNINTLRPIIGFFPGSEFGPAKRWPHYHYAAIAEKLINEKGYSILLFSSIKDYDAGKNIYQSLTENSRRYCINLSGKTSLEQAMNLISHCQAGVSNDSGLMHIAAALDKPIIVLYGQSSPSFTPPLSDKSEVIRLISGYHKIRKGHSENGYHQSLIDIQPQLVMDALTRLQIGIN